MARKQSTFLMSRIVKSKAEDIVTLRKNVARLSTATKTFEPAFAVANHIADTAKGMGFGKYQLATPEVYEHWDKTTSYVLHVCLEDSVDSMKEGVVPSLIEFIESLGFECVDTVDYAGRWSADRTFKFKAKIGLVDVSLGLVANVKDGSEACRKVQVGTEIQEVPKYQIVCE